MALPADWQHSTAAALPAHSRLETLGAAGVGGITTLGGLVGSNQGEAGAGSAQISNSFARGNVGDLKIANLQAGGFVGSDAGIIQSSVALGMCSGRPQRRGRLSPAIDKQSQALRRPATSAAVR